MDLACSSVIMGSTFGFVTFNKIQYSPLTGLPVNMEPSALQRFGKNETSGKITDYFFSLKCDSITDTSGEIHYYLDGVAKKTTVFLGCTLEWLIYDDSQHFHPSIYSELFTCIKNNPFFINK